MRSMLGSIRPWWIIVASIALRLNIAWAAAPERIYIACDDHTDYYWSADAATYRQAFIDMIDYYLARADATEQEPTDFQARFNCDGSLWMWEYERNKSADDFVRLIKRIKDGHISVPLTPITLCYGAMPMEAVLRGMYYAGRIERRYNLRLTTVQPMEDQTMPYGLGSLFAGAGAKYAWMGICNCATRVSDNAIPRPHEIYWWSGLDDRRLLMKWNSLESNAGMGGYAEARESSRIVEYMDHDAGYLARWKYPLVKAAFGKGHDDLKTLTNEFEIVARNKTTANRKVRNSNEIDFFEDFEATYGSALPSFAAAFGNEWDLYPASLAEVTARVKRSVEKLRTAEAMAVFASLSDPKFMSGRETARDQALMNMGLYFNHDWTADSSVVTRDQFRDWAKALASQIESYVNTLHADASTTLGCLIKKNGSQTRFYAFNSLGWTRTESADFPYAGDEPIHVVDLATGQDVPSQFVTFEHKRYVRVLALDVPGVGYKVFEIQPGAGKSFAPAATVKNNTLENSVYKVTMDGRGAIGSLIDKLQANREFARPFERRLINDLGEGVGQLSVRNAGAVSVTLLAESSAGLAHTTEVTLFRDSRRVDIRNEIIQNFQSSGDNPPHWAFSFNLDSPEVWHEEVGAIIRAKLLSAGGHYSPDHARYDWQTLNHFADMSGGGVGVTLANSDCLFMKIGKSTVASLDTNTPQLNVLVGGQIDAPLGIPGQGGDSHFRQRFALQTHGGYNEAQAMRFALEQQNPLATGAVTGESAYYPESSYGLLVVSNPEFLLWCLKPAEEGVDKAGIALRFWNMSTASTTCSVTMLHRQISTAQHATHLETPIGKAQITNGALQVEAVAHALETYLLQPVN